VVREKKKGEDEEDVVEPTKLVLPALPTRGTRVGRGRRRLRVERALKLFSKVWSFSLGFFSWREPSSVPKQRTLFSPAQPRGEERSSGSSRRNGGAAEGLEGGIRQIWAVLVQVVQIPHWQGRAPPRQNGPGHPVRRIHARA
jgi:hypothetical protein